MASSTQRGYLVLADIAGYTSYLAGVELDHAHDILSDLLEIIVGHLETLLSICKLEGDAVFAYAHQSALPRGETLLELVETTYAAFCKRRETVQRRTTCTCSACRAIPSLDLKFFVHVGDYVVQHIANRIELVGSDVNLVHRLMKNHVSEATGWRAYVLFTEPALQRVGVRPEGLHAQTEGYEHLGQVQTHSLDLQAGYEQALAARRMHISANEADYVLVQDFPAAPPLVWEWLNDAAMRNIWASGSIWSVGVRPHGRTGPGARNHCAHGKGETVETIMDWRPYDYCSVESLSDGMLLRETMQLEPLPGGNATRLHDHIIVSMPVPRPLRRLLVRFVMNHKMKYREMMANAAHLLAEELARRKAQSGQSESAPQRG